MKYMDKQPGKNVIGSIFLVFINLIIIAIMLLWSRDFFIFGNEQTQDGEGMFVYWIGFGISCMLIFFFGIILITMGMCFKIHLVNKLVPMLIPVIAIITINISALTYTQMARILGVIMVVGAVATLSGIVLHFFSLRSRPAAVNK